MSGEFQDLTGKKLGQAAVTATAAIVYETPVNTRTYIKDIMVANTTGGSLDVQVYIVASGGAAATSNALIYNKTIATKEYLQWSGLQITNSGDTIQVLGSSTGLTITISGAEAV